MKREDHRVKPVALKVLDLTGSSKVMDIMPESMSREKTDVRGDVVSTVYPAPVRASEV